MNVIRTVTDLQRQSRDWRREDKRIALVPTMGALHEGHLSLIRRAREEADVVIVSIFVNPTQFGENEDLDSYPRTWDADCAACDAEGTDVIFFPGPSAMYANDASTWVTEEKLTQPLCGTRRPGHFRGVTTIVAKLFLAALPDIAVFGQKDAQQALVIKRMVRDLNFPVEVVVAPIVREPDGLAMSSRNRYLSEDERQRALAISRGVNKAADAFKEGVRTATGLIDIVADEILSTGGEIDYVEIRDAETLEPVDVIETEALLAVAATYGPARLLDNAILTP